MKHFTSPGDKIGIFYSDNAPELVSAMKVLQWRHVISKDYISKTNAVAERLVRSVLEGTRVNLLQSGLHHQYWPHAARHWCFMSNVIQVGEEATPWKIRFGENFKGPKIPFGCQIDYGTGPRKRPKPDLKYEPTSKPGIFLGYVVHPGFDFRTEFIVASLKEIRLASFDEKVNVVMKILFAARMARFDLLRAVQGLAARVTKWSTECDKALHRLICYIHSTLDVKLRAFIGDSIANCKLWCFADADHAGEYDNRSTSGCFLVLIGPNSYFPLTAFSKKQTSVSMSSTEAEVVAVAANITLRAVGLPSSGLWAYLQNAGGDESIPGGLPTSEIECNATVKGDKWIYDPSRRILIIEHSKPRQPLFDPKSDKTSPIDTRNLGSARTSIRIVKGKVDFIQDNWRKRGEYPVSDEWIGISCFRVYGPYESDPQIESDEVREALTDYDFVGNERSGDMLLNLVPPQSIRGVFVEDNQATIRILENGKSPTSRHTDKTQRENLSWLEEQFKRKWYKMVHCPSILQAADIMTKPFTNSEKWKFATALLSHVRVDDKGKTTEPRSPTAPPQTSQAASATRDDSTGEPGAGLKPSRLIVEVCCSPDSKLSDCSRPSSKGCVVYQFTEDYSLLSEENRAEIARKVNQFPKSKKVLFWLSLPCTGGTTWSYVNLKHPTAKMKVLKEVRKFWKLRVATCKFIDLIERDFDIAMEWPTGCRYWKSRKIRKFLEAHLMEKYNFHGCMLGTKNHDGIAIKKPWTVATSIPEIGHSLVKYQCDGLHEHVAGRGIDLKATELYTWDFVDIVHAALQQSTGVSKLALPCVRFHPVMSLAIPNYLPASQSDADKVVAEIVGQTRVEAYEVTKYWEKRLIDLRLGALATAFEDSSEGVEMLGGSQQPIPDLIETTITTDTDPTFYSYPEIRNIFRSVPPYYFGVAES